MTATLTIKDEAINGDTLHEFSLDFLTETITVRELIRSRVYQEVNDYNTAQRQANQALSEHVFQGLVQPSDMAKTRDIDWQAQFEQAQIAFEHNQILIIVDKNQVEDLDQEIVLGPQSTASFLKLTPLVGG